MKQGQNITDGFTSDIAFSIGRKPQKSNIFDDDHEDEEAIEDVEEYDDLMMKTQKMIMTAINELRRRPELTFHP